MIFAKLKTTPRQNIFNVLAWFFAKNPALFCANIFCFTFIVSFSIFLGENKYDILFSHAAQIEILDKNQLYVNYSEIEDADYKVSETNKRLNKLFYGDK